MRLTGNQSKAMMSSVFFPVSSCCKKFLMRTEDKDKSDVKTSEEPQVIRSVSPHSHSLATETKTPTNSCRTPTTSCRAQTNSCRTPTNSCRAQNNSCGAQTNSCRAQTNSRIKVVYDHRKEKITSLQLQELFLWLTSSFRAVSSEANPGFRLGREPGLEPWNQDVKPGTRP